MSHLANVSEKLLTSLSMQVIQWMQNPVPISAIRDFEEWKATCTPSGQPVGIDHLKNRDRGFGLGSYELLYYDEEAST